MKQTTKPWLPLDVGWWPNIAIELPKPWPRDAVLMDLRWWADQECMGRKKRPGRPALCERWGWTDWQARATMKDEASWKARLQPASSPPPTPIQNGAPKPPESHEPTSNAHPARLQPASTRADLQTTHNKQQTSDPKHKVNPNLGLADTWKKINDARKEGGKARALKLTSKRRRHLNARLQDHKPEDLLRVIDWYLRSSHDRALFLREGGYDVDTLIGTKFDMYLEMAHSDAERVHTPKQGSYRSLSDLLDEALDEPETLNRVVIPFTNQE